MPDSMTAAPVLDHAFVVAIARLELLVAAPQVPADAPAHASLLDELAVDARTLREFATRLEYRFGLSVPDEDWPHLRTLDEVAAYVVGRTARNAA
jgi:acyl carrier protein